MTRGKIIYIDGDYIYESIEFNGDMYPDGRAQYIVGKFQANKIVSSQDFTDVIVGFNRKYFKYEDPIIQRKMQRNNIDIEGSITDYVYIINGSEAIITLQTNNQIININPNNLAIFHYEKLERVIEQSENSKAISKTRFVEILETLQETSDLVDSIDTIIRNSNRISSKDFMSGSGLLICHDDLVIDLLQEIMNDQTEMVTYFVYELDFGRKYSPGDVIDEKEEEIDLSTAEKLYEYLTAK